MRATAWTVSTLAAVLLLASAGATAAPQWAAAAPRRPSVVIIVTDDQDCHSFGARTCVSMHPTDPVPATRRWIAGSGATLTHFYSANPSCCPDRASLMTGQYPHNHGVQTLYQAGNLKPRHTIQYALKKAGYRTGMWGKYLNTGIENAPPYFDDFLRVRQGTYYDSPINDNGHVGRAGATVYAQTLIADRATAFIRSTPTDQPLYAYVNYTAPHMRDEAHNLDPLPETRYASAPVPVWRAPTETDRTDKPSFIRRAVYLPRLNLQLYAARQRTLYSVDDADMRIRQALADTGRLADTLVIYVSDNGYALGEHNLRGKFNPYLPSLQIPGALSWPGHIAAGTLDGRLTSMVDIAPTVYDATGVPAPALVDGHSLLQPGTRRSIGFGEYQYDIHANKQLPTWATTVTAGRQVTAWYTGDGTVQTTESYDLGTDPNEMSNTDSATTIDVALLSAFRRCTGSGCFR